MKLLLPLLLLAVAARADWPTYQHDASRVGATAEPLAAPLRPAWSHASPVAPTMAWPGEDGRVIEGFTLINRIRFDDVFHTAIADGRVFFGSSVDGRVYCRDLASGREIWAVWTDGPVRLAPHVVDGKVFIGSDDGYAYCLDAATGRVVWKLRAGPNDERILARGRMISRWPVRTGVLVDDGIAYFGAGVFPHENIYLYAVEAATGKVVWKNDAISQDDAGRNDLTPQGYLLATKDTLFVPSGRTLAAAFKRATGEFLSKPQPGWRGDGGGQVGGTQAFLADDQIYSVGEHHILALDQDKQKTGFGWFAGTQMTLAGDMGYMANGKEIVAIDRIKHAEGTRERHKAETKAAALDKDLKKHPALDALKKLQKSPKDAELAQGYEKLRGDYQAKKDEITRLKATAKEAADTGIKWRFASPHDSALILAGNTLVAGGKGEVVGLDTASGKELWKFTVDGEARGLAASGGHLVVSTTTGKVYAFADASQPASQPLADTKPAPLSTDTAIADAADAILAQTGIKRGFCLVVGLEKGQLAHELAKRSQLTIYAVDPDEAKVRAARESLVKTGIYGSRIVVDHLDLSVIPYASYFANLIVSETALATGKMPGLPAEVARTLKPLGGTICLPAKASAWLAATKLDDEGAKLTTSGEWAKLVRGKLPGADSWSHQYGNAANTSSNQDTRIKGGLSVLWYGDPGPGKMTNRHDGAVGPLSVNGRLFVQGHESIMAYDAYNGQFLWETPNPGALRIGVYNAREPGNMAASDDYFFMQLDEKCLQFDAATGAIVHTFTVPGEAKENLQWGYIAVQDGLLYGTATERVANAAEAARRGKSASINTDTIFAYDVKTGALVWKHQGQHIAHTTIAIDDGRVIFVDSSLTPAQREDMLRQDKTALAKLTGRERDIAEERIKKADLRMAVALDARTGAQQWAKPVDVTDCSEIGIGGGALTLMVHNGHVVLGGANANGHYWEQFLKGEFARRRLVVLNANSGDKIWAKDANYRHRPVIIGNEIIAEPWSYDLYSGTQKMRTHPITGEQTEWMFARPGHHCGAISATPSMMFFRSKSTAFYDRDKDEGTEHFAGQRLGCWINTIPANGLVMIPEASAGCVCLFSIAATIVFEPRESRSQWGVYSATGSSLPVQHMALNLGAPGDRRDAHGKLWLGYPRPSSRAGIDLPLDFKPEFAEDGGFFALNAESVKVEGAETPWIFTSGARGLKNCTIPLLAAGAKPETFTVRLSFMALEGDQPGQRVFDVKLQGTTVLAAFDPAAKAGGPLRAFTAEFKDIAVTDNLTLELASKLAATDEKHQPIISAVEIVRRGAAEILRPVAGR